MHSWNLTTPSLWWDEAATKASFRNGWSSIDAITRHLDVVHKLYYQLIYANTLVFGDSTLSLRLPSAIAAALACVGLVELSRQFGLGRPAGYIGAVFLALTPRMFWASLEARSYSMTVFTGIMTVLLLGLAVKGASKSNIANLLRWLALTLFFCFAVYLYVYQLLLVIPMATYLLLTRPGRRTWYWALGSLTIVAAAAIPLVLTAKNQQGQVAWNRLRTNAIPGLLGSQAFMDQLLPFVITLAMLGFLAVKNRRTYFDSPSVGRHAPGRVAAIVGLVWAFAPSLVLMSASLLGSELYNSRYVSFALGGWALMLAGLVAGGTRNIRLGIALVVVLAIVEAAPLAAMRGPVAYKSDWKQAAVNLERVAKPGDAVIFGDAWMYPIRRVSVMKAAYPEAFRGLTDYGLTTNRAELFDDRLSWQHATGAIRGFKTVWLILDQRMDSQEVGRAAKVLGRAGYRAGAPIKATFTWLVPFRQR